MKFQVDQKQRKLIITHKDVNRWVRINHNGAFHATSIKIFDTARLE